MRRFSTAALALTSSTAAAAVFTRSSPARVHADHQQQQPSPAAAAAAANARLRMAVTPNPNSSSSSSSAAASTDVTASAGDMVPITADLLRAHYANFRSPSLDPALTTARESMIALREALLNPTTGTTTSTSSNPAHPATAADADAVATTTTTAATTKTTKGPGDAPPVAEVLTQDLPPGLDSSLFRLRLSCEEAANRLDFRPPAGATVLPARLRATAARVAAFQQRQTAHVDAMVRGLLPHDFRASLFAAARTRSERANAAALDGLPLRARYDLLWQQQWRRRELLASVGSSTGIWRWVVRYLAGVPEPLLAFAKEINAPNGPTGALRDKFGAQLAELVQFAVEINALCAAATLQQQPAATPAANAPNDSALVDEGAVAKVLTSALDQYDKEVDSFVELLEEVIVNSPFFVRPDELARYRDGGTPASADT